RGSLLQQQASRFAFAGCHSAVEGSNHERGWQDDEARAKAFPNTRKSTGVNMKGQISTLVRRLNVSKRLAVSVILFGLVGIVPHLAVTQEQSDVEAESQQSPLIGVTSSTDNPLQLALLHWYNANLTTHFSVGAGPVAVAFDGANIWVANVDTNNV